MKFTEKPIPLAANRRPAARSGRLRAPAAGSVTGLASWALWGLVGCSAAPPMAGEPVVTWAPPPSMVTATPGTALPRPDDRWAMSRNDDRLAPGPAVHPWEWTGVELRSVERTRTVNGHPSEYSRTVIRTRAVR